MTRYSGPIRRSQLVGYGGVGSLTTSTDGTTLIAAGLDHWFPEDDSRATRIDINEYKVEEWRLQREMAVDHFRLPPDYREHRYGYDTPNAGLTIPYLRFPRWHVCRWCHRMQRVPSTERGKARCQHCATKSRWKRGPALTQVPFVAMCEYGHIQEFPWAEWVHRALEPGCTGTLKLNATGSASLGAIRVECTLCGATRSLASITFATPSEDGDRTHLSTTLSREGEYVCSGARPWHDEHSGLGCGRQLRGALLSAANVYFGLVKSAIYIPRSSASAPPRLVGFLEQPQPAAFIALLKQAGQTSQVNALRLQFPKALSPYSDTQIDDAIQLLDGAHDTPPPSIARASERDAAETRFRREEYHVIRKPHTDDRLLIRESPTESYANDVSGFFSRIMLLDKLRETRVQYGFNRVFAESSYDAADRQSLLWKDYRLRQESWLPAYTVYGEGLYFELDHDRLRTWERQPEVMTRIDRLAARYRQVQDERRLEEREITPRLVLLHTLAHLLINQLSFECGYSAASLRERLYVSQDPVEPMAGMLLYTAAGDSEGTLGGLVRMGKPRNLEAVLRRAIGGARWCSADPVCMEIGDSTGQGPDSCNLAACHSCALISETSCELHNRFLDRAVLTGSLDRPTIGYFHRLASRLTP